MAKHEDEGLVRNREFVHSATRTEAERMQENSRGIKGVEVTLKNGTDLTAGRVIVTTTATSDEGLAKLAKRNYPKGQSGE